MQKFKAYVPFQGEADWKLTTDLHLTSTQYNLCLTIFFISYSVFEIPSNIFLKRLKPHVSSITEMRLKRVLVERLYDLLGNRHDIYGIRLELLWIIGSTMVPRARRSWIVIFPEYKP